MKKLILGLALVGLSINLSGNAYAVEMKTASCWKGFSQKEQNENTSKCRNSLHEMQYCSGNMFETKGAAYDVCSMEPVTTPKNIVEHYKGFKQSEQDANLKSCRSKEGKGSVCVSNWLVHRQAVYDVCLMK